jgi:hypothetical protein
MDRSGAPAYSAHDRGLAEDEAVVPDGGPDGGEVLYGRLAQERPETPSSRPPRLLDRVRAALRTRHYSRRTEDAYVHWIRRYILFHGKRHPDTLGEVEVTAFLSALAVTEKVAASTQNQALAMLFLYREMLGRDPQRSRYTRLSNPQHRLPCPGGPGVPSLPGARPRQPPLTDCVSGLPDVARTRLLTSACCRRRGQVLASGVRIQQRAAAEARSVGQKKVVHGDCSRVDRVCRQSVRASAESLPSRVSPGAGSEG